MCTELYTTNNKYLGIPISYIPTYSLFTVLKSTQYVAKVQLYLEKGTLEIQNSLAIKSEKHFFLPKTQKPCIFKAFGQNPCISSVLGTN